MSDASRGIYAGVFISIGGTVFLRCENKVVGAFLFSIGLFAVLVFGCDLYTGKVCNIDYLLKPVSLIKIWFFNLIGTLIMGLIISLNPEIYQTANDVALLKLNKSNPVIMGFICGICIAIAVKGYAFAEGIGKYLSIILGVMTFILCGSEHVVADMFYFSAARMINVDVIKFILLVTVGNTLGGILFPEIVKVNK